MNNETGLAPEQKAQLDGKTRRTYRDASVIEVTVLGGQIYVSVDGYTVIDATGKNIKVTAHYNV